MSFVQRNDTGEIIALYAVEQPGIAEEWVEEATLSDLDVPKRYSKRWLFEAMSEAEYETFEAVEAKQPPKDRRVFRESTELNEADPGFDRFLALMVNTYGKARAAELLAAAEY